MSIRNTYPTIRPSLNLDFARSRKLDPRITFSRTTTGTYMDSDGLIKVASADEARFDHKYEDGNIVSLGLLVEESRSNLITYSEQFDNAAWGTSPSYTVGIDSTTAPDGTTSAEKLIRNTTNIQAQIYRNITDTSTNTTYTLSCFCKSAEWSKIGLREGVSTGYWATFDLSVGEKIDNGAGTTSTITPYPNEWYRISMTLTTTSTQTSYGVRIIPLPDSYTSGTPYVNQSGNDVDGLYLWGAQLEEGAFPTSYMPTSASQFTREPDKVSMEGDNFSDWYNPTEGTIVLDCTPVYDNSSNQYRRLVSIHNNSGAQTDVIQFIQAEATNQVLSAVWDGASPQSGFGKVVPSGTRHKVAFAVKENNMNASYDGSIGTDDTSATLPVMTEMDIGSYSQFSSTRATTHYNSLRYYPTRLTNTQLQTLTK